MFLYLFNKVYVNKFYYIILVGFGFNNISICNYFMLKKKNFKMYSEDKEFKYVINSRIVVYLIYDFLCFLLFL